MPVIATVGGGGGRMKISGTGMNVACIGGSDFSGAGESL
jgi:hypothetical protein